MDLKIETTKWHTRMPLPCAPTGDSVVVGILCIKWPANYSVYGQAIVLIYIAALYISEGQHLVHCHTRSCPCQPLPTA